ncbi:MAG: copper-translocating P-type ATPase [Coxiellaceae bacterium]|nr:copper-translocating P-type ATPase [Coxiellaceae bacterium]
MSSCCDMNKPQASGDEEHRQYKQLVYKSIVAIVVGAIFFIGPYIGIFPELETTAGHWFWPISLVIVAGVIFYTGRHFYIGAYQSFLNHTANMDTLVASGTFAAWLYSAISIVFGAFLPDVARAVYFDTACLVIGFVVLGSAMEMKARGQTNAAIARLMELAPDTAIVVRHGEDKVVSIEDIQVGDTVRLRPGDRVPVDGKVIEGETLIDESMLTGEPLPVKKTIGDEVVTGTSNQKGSVLFHATRVGADTALANIIETVQKAQRSKPAIGKLTDKIASVFAPLVLILALVTAIFWLTFGPPPVIAHVLMTGIAVLLIACPCALGLATPISIMIAVGKAAEHGIIVRNGDALQKAKSLTAVVLDKTGTITQGKPSVTDVVAVAGYEGNQVLRYAASIEGSSEHPLAQAVVTRAKELELNLLAVESFEALSGLGVKATVDGQQVLLGNRRFMVESKIDCTAIDGQVDDLMRAAKTPVYVVVDNQLAGFLAISDAIKADSKQAIAQFKELGLRVVMLTGDSRATAAAVAKEVGIDEKDIFAEVLPVDKDQAIAQLAEQGEIVAMCGDGINDAAALARADVGFAIGSGTDIAIDSADMVLMNDSLSCVVTAIQLSRATMRNIKQNLFGAFIYNVCGIPIAAGVFFPLFGVLLSPIIAGIAMAASSLTVVINANRLRLVRLK